jgi:hypothetical protein
VTRSGQRLRIEPYLSRRRPVSIVSRDKRGIIGENAKRKITNPLRAGKNQEYIPVACMCHCAIESFEWHENLRNEQTSHVGARWLEK